MEKSEVQQQPAGDVLTKQSDNVVNFIKSSPAMMAELTQQFVSKKGLSDRAKIRLQMKAVLDMISVDTEYPSAEKKEAKEDYSPRRYDGGGRLVDAPDSRQNENILGGAV